MLGAVAGRGQAPEAYVVTPVQARPAFLISEAELREKLAPLYFHVAALTSAEFVAMLS